ncbi:hypothetical protein FQZ97_738460 [compost metagenome]
MIGHHVAQAIGAKEVQVAVFNAVFVDFQQHRVLDPQRPGDEVLVGGELGLFLGDQTGVDLLLQQGVVARDLLQGGSPQSVAARIAHMADHGSRSHEHPHDHGGAHPRVHGVGVGGVEDRAVGVVDADLHRPLEFAGIGLVPALDQPAAQLFLDERGGHGAGHFTRVVAAHAIGQHHQMVFSIQGDRVFVVVTDQARVREGGVLKVHVERVYTFRCDPSSFLICTFVTYSATSGTASMGIQGRRGSTWVVSKWPDWLRALSRIEISLPVRVPASACNRFSSAARSAPVW